MAFCIPFLTSRSIAATTPLAHSESLWNAPPIHGRQAPGGMTIFSRHQESEKYSSSSRRISTGPLKIGVDHAGSTSWQSWSCSSARSCRHTAFTKTSAIRACNWRLRIGTVRMRQRMLPSAAVAPGSRARTRSTTATQVQGTAASRPGGTNEGGCCCRKARDRKSVV